MCKAPKPPPPKEPDKPEWLRNPYLDAAVGQSGAVDQLRSGRSSLRIDLGSGLGIRSALPQPGTPTPVTSPPPGAIRPRPGSRGSRRYNLR